MSETRRKERVTALVLAITFFVFASALTIGVIVQSVTSKKNSGSSASTANATKPKTTLQGTQLASFTPTNSVTALQTTDTTVGTGAEAKAGDTVTVDYTGAVASSGTIFQSSKDTGQPATFSLSQVIKGWTDGIPGMKVGGTRRLLIPADQAYGGNPPSGSGIPANAALVFDVTLDKVGS